MKEHYTNSLLVKIKRTFGSRHYILLEGLVSLLNLSIYYLGFLDEYLSLPIADNILQTNLFAFLSSSEIIANAYFCAIIHFTLCFSLYWFDGNTHKNNMTKLNGSIRPLGHAINTLKVALECIELTLKFFLRMIL